MSAPQGAREKLRAALKRYGYHAPTCPAYRNDINGKIRGGFADPEKREGYTEKCNCGFDEALRL